MSISFNEQEILQIDVPALVQQEKWFKDRLTIYVVGASGDLAKKKTYPALLALYAQNLLPKHTSIWGYARSAMTHDELRAQLRPYLLQALSMKRKDKNMLNVMESFLKRCHYKRGKSYGDEKAWREMIQQQEQQQSRPEPCRSKEQCHNQLFYLAVPPNVFGETGRAIHATVRTNNSHNGNYSRGWSRIVIEKPFGRDLESCQALLQTFDHLFREDQLYRIDHYLGKEMVQNILFVRFGNSILERLWNRDMIHSIMIIFKERIGTQGRGGYFDNYGIIRDVIQNHLLQILMLITMEPTTTGDIRTAKCNLLQHMPLIKSQDILLGQYNGYADDDTIVNKSTTCPTYAAIRCFVDKPRWHGVPIMLEAGKALNEHLCEVRIKFQNQSCSPHNELVLRLQPDPAIYLTTNIKAPGFASQSIPVALGMDYKTLLSNKDGTHPDAYTRLILDVLRGRSASFVGRDELLESWKLFSPLLQETTTRQPHPYEFGSSGPKERDAFMRQKMSEGSNPLRSAL